MSDIVKNAFENVNPENQQFINKNVDIVEEIYALMEAKGLNKADLAKLLKKKRSEITKLLSGTHNLTLRSITKLELALEEDLIMTCSKAKKKFEKVNYVHVNKDVKINTKGSIASGVAFQKTTFLMSGKDNLKLIA